MSPFWGTVTLLLGKAHIPVALSVLGSFLCLREHFSKEEEMFPTPISPLFKYLLFLSFSVLKFHSLSFYLIYLFNAASILLGVKTERSPEQTNSEL